MRGHARLVAAVIDKLTLTNWGAPQTTNLGVGSSNLSGRAIKSMDLTKRRANRTAIARNSGWGHRGKDTRFGEAPLRKVLTLYTS